VKQQAISQVKVHTFLVVRLPLINIAIHNRLLILARILSYANLLHETVRVWQARHLFLNLRLAIV